MHICKTPGGLEKIDFLDRWNRPWNLQQAAHRGSYLDTAPHPSTEYLWLGPDSLRMELSYHQVRQLRDHLDAWLANGSFEITAPEEAA